MTYQSRLSQMFQQPEGFFRRPTDVVGAPGIPQVPQVPPSYPYALLLQVLFNNPYLSFLVWPLKRTGNASVVLGQICAGSHTRTRSSGATALVTSSPL